jgi:hypothetical protein
LRGYQVACAGDSETMSLQEEAQWRTVKFDAKLYEATGPASVPESNTTRTSNIKQTSATL